MKKTKTLVSVIIVFVCIAALSAAALFYVTTVYIDGGFISAKTTELDLSNRGLDNVGSLKRCKQLKKLDLRGNNITASQFDELSSALPDCEIIWSVPVGTEYFDSNISEFSFSADYVEDLYSIRYFTDISSCDVSGTKCDDERLYELNMSIPNINIYWNMSLNGRNILTNTQELDLSSATLIDPSIIKYFSELKTLKLGSNQIDDLSVLENLTKLEVLDIKGNHVSDISLLASLTELRGLSLDSTYADDRKDLSVLANLTKLENLDLTNCNGENYDVVTKLPSLKKLDLSYSFSSHDDFSFLADIHGLEELSLDYSGIMNDDLELLSGITSLKKLSLVSIHISDPSPLYSLTSLEELDVSECDLTKSQIKELKSALPGCEIKD